MSPTIVSSEEGGVIALGSPGASRIPTAILQTLVNVLDFGMPLEEAVLAPRFHAEAGLFAFEPARAPPTSTVTSRYFAYEGANMYFGGINAVRRTPEGPSRRRPTQEIRRVLRLFENRRENAGWNLRRADGPRPGPPRGGHGP